MTAIYPSHPVENFHFVKIQTIIMNIGSKTEINSAAIFFLFFVCTFIFFLGKCTSYILSKSVYGIILKLYTSTIKANLFCRLIHIFQCNVEFYLLKIFITLHKDVDLQTLRRRKIFTELYQMIYGTYNMMLPKQCQKRLNNSIQSTYETQC